MSTCDHAVCLITDAPACLYGPVGISQGSHMGHPPPTNPPVARVKEAEDLMASISPDALRAEVERVKMLRAVKRLAQIADSERRDVHSSWSQSDADKRRALLDAMVSWDDARR